MKPEIWGPHMWYIMHIISFNYPINPTEYHKRAYREFYTNIKDILPCEKCQRHYSQYLSTYPISPHLDNRANLIKWVIQVHNFVNQSLGKRTYTVAQVLLLYKNLKPQSPFDIADVSEVINPLRQRKYRIFTIMIILAILILYAKYYHYRHYYS